MIEMLKLVTGEDIIGDCTYEDNHWRIKKAVKVLYTPQGLAMIPYDTFYKDGDFTVPKEHVVLHGEVGDDIRNAYAERFGSGIVTAKSAIKLHE